MYTLSFYVSGFSTNLEHVYSQCWNPHCDTDSGTYYVLHETFLNCELRLHKQILFNYIYRLAKGWFSLMLHCFAKSQTGVC